MWFLKDKPKQKQKSQEQIWAAPPLDPPAAQAGALQGLNCSWLSPWDLALAQGWGCLGNLCHSGRNAGQSKSPKMLVLFMGLPQLALSVGSLMCFWGTPDVARLLTGPRGADSSAHPARLQPAASSKAILGAEDLTQGRHLGEFCLKSTFIRVVMTSLGCNSMSPAKHRCGHLVARSRSSNGVEQVPLGKQILTLGVHCWHAKAPRMASRSLQGGGVLL